MKPSAAKNRRGRAGERRDICQGASSSGNMVRFKCLDAGDDKRWLGRNNASGIVCRNKANDWTLDEELRLSQFETTSRAKDKNNSGNKNSNSTDEGNGGERQTNAVCLRARKIVGDCMGSSRAAESPLWAFPLRDAQCSTGVNEPRGSEDVSSQWAWKVIQGSVKLSATDVLRSGHTSQCFGPRKAAFFGYFLCSGKESDPRPGEGRTNRPTRIEAKRCEGHQSANIAKRGASRPARRRGASKQTTANTSPTKPHPYRKRNTHAACLAEGNRETNRKETVNPSN